jgi:hypothetical protein
MDFNSAFLEPDNNVFFEFSSIVTANDTSVIVNDTSAIANGTSIIANGTSAIGTKSSPITIGGINFLEFISKTNERTRNLEIKVDEMDKKINDTIDRIGMICSWFELTQDKN